MKEQRKNKGITLIALVITIIILLILAAVGIATLTGENGILTRANDSKIKNELAKVQEAYNLKIADIQIERYPNTGSIGSQKGMAGDIEGLAKLVKISDIDKDVYVIKDLSKLDITSTLGKGTIPEKTR